MNARQLFGIANSFNRLNDISKKKYYDVLTNNTENIMESLKKGDSLSIEARDVNFQHTFYNPDEFCGALVYLESYINQSEIKLVRK